MEVLVSPADGPAEGLFQFHHGIIVYHGITVTSCTIALHSLVTIIIIIIGKYERYQVKDLCLMLTCSGALSRTATPRAL